MQGNLVASTQIDCNQVELTQIEKAGIEIAT